MEVISSRLAIETLEYLHDLLSEPDQKERRGHIKAMIEAYRANENKEQRANQTSSSPYVPPGL